MSAVQTIRGPVDSSELGATLSHEHLAPQPSSAGIERMAGWYDEDATVEADIAALRKAKQAGIDSLIDLTPLDLGRQIPIFQRVAEADTGVHVVAATGVYRHVPMHFVLADVDAIAEFFLREIQEGIEGTSIRAGIIKIAWDLEASLDAGAPMSPRGQLEKTARAAARAARAGGVPISCHTRAVDELGTPLLDIFEDEGLDLAAVTIGHTNDSSDLDYIKSIAARGANVGLDRYSMRYDDAERVRRAGIALTLAQAGYAEQTRSATTASRSACSRTGRTSNAGCPCTTLEVPWLLANGATQAHVDAMLKTSIRRTFEAAAGMTPRS